MDSFFFFWMVGNDKTRKSSVFARELLIHWVSAWDTERAVRMFLAEMASLSLTSPMSRRESRIHSNWQRHESIESIPRSEIFDRWTSTCWDDLIWLPQQVLCLRSVCRPEWKKADRWSPRMQRLLTAGVLIRCLWKRWWKLTCLSIRWGTTSSTHRQGKWGKSQWGPSRQSIAS